MFNYEIHTNTAAYWKRAGVYIAMNQVLFYSFFSAYTFKYKLYKEQSSEIIYYSKEKKTDKIFYNTIKNQKIKNTNKQTMYLNNIYLTNIFICAHHTHTLYITYLFVQFHLPLINRQL